MNETRPVILSEARNLGTGWRTSPQWRDLSEDLNAPPQTLRCAQGDNTKPVILGEAKNLAFSERVDTP